MISTIANYNMIVAREEAWLTATAGKPAVANDSRIYLQRIAAITSIGEFLKDDRVLRFALKAYGLEDMANAKGFLRKVLYEGIDSSAAFANRLSDSRYREFVSVFNFNRYGTTTTIFDRTRNGTVERYVRQTLEEDAGQQNGNVRLALYFQRKAPAITSSYQILADKALTTVVFAALGLPSSTSAMDVDSQARLLNSKLEFSDFRTPDKLNGFIAKYAARADATSSLALNVPNALLLSSAPQSVSLGSNVLIAVQAARRR